MHFPHPVRPWPWAVVEIAGDADALERARLIRTTYRSSRAGVVGLVLSGISRSAIDRVLDTVVDAVDGELAGVVYLDDDDRSVNVAAAHASIVIASTERFRSKLTGWGIVPVGITVGERLLDGRSTGVPSSAA